MGLRCLYIFVFCAWLGWGCELRKSFFSGVDSSEKIARVGDEHLLFSEVQERFPFLEKEGSGSSSDASEVLRLYALRWARRQVLSSHAEKILDKSRRAEIVQKAKEHAEMLWIYELEKDLLNDFQVSITQKEISDYYQENKTDLVTKQDMVELVYLRVPRDSKERNRIRRWMRKLSPADWNKEGSRRDFSEYCAQKEIICHACLTSECLKPGLPRFVHDVVRLLPSHVSVDSWKEKKGKFLEFEDKNNFHFLYIFERLEAGRLPPLYWVQEKITKEIEGKKRQIYLEARREEIWRDMEKKKEIELFLESHN
ncbi:MAG: hypothetical protein OXB93_06045 [Cytophagales bacterium]|nr:hypothetical protein [Cytophagales bacterium]